MTSEQFTIPRRPAWALMGGVTVTIECDPLASAGVKLGLAVRAAFASGADLSRADLNGADLAGAYLAGASADRFTWWPDGFDPVTRGVTVR